MNNYVHKNGCSRGSLSDMKKSYISNSNIIDIEGMFIFVCIYVSIYVHMHACLDINNYVYK
jgi:hypothetical protein